MATTEELLQLEKNLVTPRYSGMESPVGTSFGDLSLANQLMQGFGSDNPRFNTSNFGIAYNNNSFAIPKNNNYYSVYQNRDGVDVFKAPGINAEDNREQEIENATPMQFEEMIKKGLVQDPDALGTGQSGSVLMNPYNPRNNKIQYEDWFLEQFKKKQNTPNIFYPSGDKGYTELVTDIKSLEQARYQRGTELVTGNNFGYGIIGANPYIKSNNIVLPKENWLDGQKTIYDDNNTVMYIEVPIDEDISKNKTFQKFRFKDSETYNDLKDGNVLGKANISAIEMANTLINKGVILNQENGTKLIPLNTEAIELEKYQMNMGMAADVDKSYAIGQAGQLAIEFLPVIGVFEGLTKAGFNLAIKGGKTIKGSFDNIANGALSTATEKELLEQGVSKNDIKLIKNQAILYAKAQKTSITKPAPEISGSNKLNAPPDKKINKLYNDILSGKIILDEQPYGYQINVGGKLNPLFDKNSYVYTTPFKEMTKNQKQSMQRSLYNYAKFVENKGNKITPNELQNLLTEKLDGYEPSKYFSSIIRADGARVGDTGQRSGGSSFGLTIRETLKPIKIDGGGNMAFFFKPPTATQLKIIEKAWDNRSQQPLRGFQIERINKISSNKKINEIMIEQRRLPEIKELQKIFPNSSTNELAKTVTEYLELLDGKTFYTGTQGKVNSVRTRRVLANELFEKLRQGGSGGDQYNYYRNAAYTSALNQMDSVITRNIKQQTAKEYAVNILKNNGVDTKLVNIHEPASVVTSARFNMHSYANFIVPELAVKNKGPIALTQGYLSKQLIALQDNQITIKQAQEKYNKYVANQGLRVDEVVSILPPTRKAIEKWYGKENVTRYLEEYGMDLVGEAKKAGFAFGVSPKAMVIDDFLKDGGFGYSVKGNGNAMGGTPISRKKFEEGSKKKVFSIYLDPDRFVSSGQRSNDPVDLAAEEEMVTERYDEYNLQEFQKQQREFLSSEKPLKFKFTELLNPSKMADNPLIRRGINANVYGTAAYFMELAEIIANGFKVDPQQTNLGFGGTKDESIPADPDRLQFEEYFPYLHKFYKMSTDPLPKTPDEQVYTSAIDEFNRGFDRGLLNLSYDIFDLGTAGLDLGSAALGKDTAFQKALKDSFDKMDKSEPETWLGKISTIATEFGVPGGVAFKIVNRFRKLLGGAFGANLFTESTLGLTGTKYATTAVTNISKAAGTNALAFGLTDVVAGGPYNAVSEYFGKDPLLFDGPNKGLYQLEDTTNLKGAELALANFRNRLRFGADGAIIGGMFPLVGAGLKYIGGPAVSKIGAPVAGAALTVVDELAVKPISYLASGKIKLPFTPAGRFEKDVPILGDALSLVGKVPLVFGEFLGKDILARVGATALAPEFFGKGFANSLTGVGKEGSKKFEKAMKETFTGRLPAYKDWRMFEVTSDNALETGLKRFDNFLGYFRDSGRQSLDRFRITGQTEATIKATQDSVESLLKMVEVRAHDLATGFLKRSNTNKTSPAGEEAMLEQVLNYLKGNIKINQLDDALKGPAQELSRTLNEIKVSFKDILPDGNDLKSLLSTDLKGYIRQSFAVFSNPKFNIIDRAMEAGYKTGKGFVNAEEKLIYENALNYITKQIQKNEEMLSLAGGTKEGLRKEARNHLKEIMLKTRTEGRDPLEIMQNIARENLFLDDLIVRTGDELPEAIKKFLGKQEGLRDSVVTTTASLLSQSSNMRMYQRLLDDGLENGWIFRTRDEARSAGILNPQRIASKTDGRMAGITGELQPEITKYFAGPDVAHSVGQSKGGMLDSLYQNFVVQNLIAYKAGVQTMKTVFSPATQTRNFGSAMFFPLNMGHIGGRASVTDAFKIVMDDIFGAGRTANQEQMIRYLKRQKELGVIDENIVVSELQAVLQDIKSGQLKTIGGMAERINNSSLVKGATKLYAGGDNVWKLYGHEFVKSQLKDIGFKTVDEVSAYMKKMFGQSIDEVSFLSNRVKTVKEAIEEAAAYTIRETYPTYSKVPDLVKFFRRMPFVGNFVSFPAEILRTSMATTGYALKHIADDNPMLRQMGYRTLMGQATAVGGAGAIFSGLGHAYTGITEGQIRNYQQNFAPDFMRYSQLMPIAKIPRRNFKGEIIKRKKKNDLGKFVYDKDGKHVMEPVYVNGQFKVFDLSRYLPYDLISSTARSFLNAYSGPKRETLDPSMVDNLVLKKFFMTAGPLFDLAKGTFFGTSIGYEPVLPLINSGKDKNGKPIWGPNDSLGTKTDKFMAHWFNTVEPGGLSSAQKVFDALQGDVQKGSGMPMELKDELFKLFGGSTVTVDLQSSLKYKVKDFKDTFPESRMTEDYFSTKDYMTRGPKFITASYNQQNREAFAEQYEFYRTVRAAQGRNNLPEKRIEAQRISDLPDAEREERFQGKSRGRIFVLLQKDDAILNEDQILQVMIDRLGETRAVNILNGVFTPLSTGEKGLDTRRKTIERNNPVLNGKYNYDYFMPIGELETLKAEWSTKTFEEYETQYMEERQRRIDARNNNQSSVAPAPEIETPEAPVAPLPDSGEVQVAETQPAAGVVNQATGLTSTETALLDRDEQLIRQRQRGTV